jgi:DNA-binding transcriptional LysR family regulator
MAPPLRLPPLHALAAFEAAARLGGFAPAAAELCITPSAVSHRIRQLEAQLGEALFERSPGGVRLSEAGARHLGSVREAFDKLAQLAQGGAAPAPARLRVGAPPTFARNLLIPRLPDFYRQWPDIEIEVAVQAPLQDKPPRHDVDIRFGNGRFDERPATRLFEDRLLVLATPGYAANARCASRPTCGTPSCCAARCCPGGPGSPPPAWTGPSRRAARASPTWASCWRPPPAAWAWRCARAGWRRTGRRRGSCSRSSR